MIRILIWYNKDNLKPIGGPSGYLYNLWLGLNKLGEENINKVDFLNYKEHNKSVNKNYKNSLLRFFKPFFSLIFRLIRKLDLNTITNNLSDYDLIHFHNSIDFFANRKSIRKLNCKVILTSHSPKPYYREFIEDNLKLNYLQYIFFCVPIFFLKFSEFYAFKKTDYLIFPALEAIEPYTNYSRWFKRFFSNNEDKIFYVETGIEPAVATNQSIFLKSKNKDNKTFCYVGRHNKVKGYDILKEAAKHALNDKFNIDFLIAGKEEPFKGLIHERWNEIGWTNRPYDYINYSDFFILPNRQTYFDIVLLEVLSLGKPVILSDTGGNKFFKKFNSAGIIYFRNMEHLKDIIVRCSEYDRLEIIKIGEINKKIFFEHFTNVKFAEKYLLLMEKL